MPRLCWVAVCTILKLAAGEAGGEKCPSLIQRQAAVTNDASGDLTEKNPTSYCEQFAEKCHSDADMIARLETWEEAQAAFELCCLGGGHNNATCTSIAGETFRSRGSFSPTEDFCEEMMDLEWAHEKWATIPASLFSMDIGSRKATLLQRVTELHASVPKLFERGFRLMKASGVLAAVAIGVHTHSSKALIMTTFAMISTEVEKCTEEQWKSFCSQSECDIDYSDRVYDADREDHGCCKEAIDSEDCDGSDQVRMQDGFCVTCKYRKCGGERPTGWMEFGGCPDHAGYCHFLEGNVGCCSPASVTYPDPLGYGEIKEKHR